MIVKYKIKDPMSALTHFIGVLLAIPGLALLIHYAVRYGTARHVVGFSIFGVSLLLLYTASTVYHSISISEKVSMILRRVDHMMIYILIAGTYTPVCLIPLKGIWGNSLLVGVWIIAIIGIILKIFWFRAPRWISTLSYLFLGWLVVIAFVPLLHTVPKEGIDWLVAGGILYSVGALIYATKWPPIASKWFGFHEIFHLFVLSGSFCHFWLMYRYVLYLG